MTSRNPNIAIIDIGRGNLLSIEQAFRQVGCKCRISASPEEILQADAVVLPGVGAFGDAMRYLSDADLISVIREVAISGKHLIGICLGMQLFFSSSEEFGLHEGLNLIAGKVVKFASKKKNKDYRFKVPQVGWNEIRKPQDAQENFWSGTSLNGINQDDVMYFMHSYYCVPEDTSVILSNSTYSGTNYCSSVMQDNIVGYQFHPERSGEQGLLIYENVLRSIKTQG